MTLQAIPTSSKYFMPRNKPTDFTRKVRLSFENLILFLLNQVKSSFQQELNSFFNSSIIPKSPYRHASRQAATRNGCYLTIAREVG